MEPLSRRVRFAFECPFGPTISGAALTLASKEWRRQTRSIWMSNEVSMPHDDEQEEEEEEEEEQEATRLGLRI